LPTDFQELSFHLTTDDATSSRRLHASSELRKNRKTKNARISITDAGISHDSWIWQ